MVSICSLCLNSGESSHHLFLSCPFAVRLWNWLGGLLNSPIDLSSSLSIFNICDSRWSKQARDVILAGIINTLYYIWHCRNKVRFDSQSINWKSVCNMIASSTSLSGNSSKHHVSSSIVEFSILKAFRVTCNPRKSPSIKQLDWLTPPCDWIKVNTDDAARGSPSLATGGGIFRDSSGAILGCFSAFFGNSFSLQAELTAVMMAIEFTFEKKWLKLWIECDSQLLVLAFSSSLGV